MVSVENVTDCVHCWLHAIIIIVQINGRLHFMTWSKDTRMAVQGEQRLARTPRATQWKLRKL